MSLAVVQLIQFNVSIEQRQSKGNNQKRGENRSSRRDLAQNAAQFVKIHRLGQVEIESSFSAALDIVTRGKRRERYGFDSSFSFRLRNHLVAISVGQGDITQNNIELFRIDHV